MRQAGCTTDANSSKEIFWCGPIYLCHVGLVADRFLTTKIVAVFLTLKRPTWAPCSYLVQGEETVAASGSGCFHCQQGVFNTGAAPMFMVPGQVMCLSTAKAQRNWERKELWLNSSVSNKIGLFKPWKSEAFWSSGVLGFIFNPGIRGLFRAHVDGESLLIYCQDMGLDGYHLKDVGIIEREILPGNDCRLMILKVLHKLWLRKVTQLHYIHIKAV